MTEQDEMLRVTILGTFFVLANLISNLSLTFQLNSIICATYFQIILPNYMWLKMEAEKDFREIAHQKQPYREFATTIMMLVGICLMGFGLKDMVVGSG